MKAKLKVSTSSGSPEKSEAAQAQFEREVALNALSAAEYNIEEAADICKDTLSHLSSAEQRRNLLRQVARAGV